MGVNFHISESRLAFRKGYWNNRQMSTLPATAEILEKLLTK